MSIAEKLVAIAENEQKVYDAGKAAERDAFWDAFQKNGERINYQYAFALGRFTEKTYNPKYDIVCSTGVTTGAYIFYNQDVITDTKVAIYANNRNANYCFNMATALETIRLFSVYETTQLNNTFNASSALKNITMAGTVGQNIDLHWSPLTKASIESVVEHLSDTSSGMTATFSEEAVLAAFGTIEAWEEYIALKPNWTFALV